MTTAPPTNAATGNLGTNVASGGAAYGNFGVVNGDSTVYVNVESPDRKLALGRNLLASSALSQARERLLEAQSLDAPAGEVGFFVCLAILHGRTVRELTSADLEQLDAQFRRAAAGTRDAFDDAVVRIRDLVVALRAHGAGPAGSHGLPDDVAAALAGLHGLPESVPSDLPGAAAVDVRREALRHLWMTTAGLDKEFLRADERARVEAFHASADAEERRQRAKLYFVPEPAEPLLLGLADDKEERRRRAALRRQDAGVVAGAVLLLLTVAAEVRLTPDITTRPLLELVVAAVAFAGATALVASSALATSLHRWAAHDDPQDDWFGVLQDLPGPAKDVVEFCKKVNLGYQQAFGWRCPADLDRAEDWAQDSRTVMVRLARATIRAYGTTHLDRPETLLWLADHHARTVFREWTDKTLEDFPEPDDTPVARSAAAVLLMFSGAVLALHALVVVALQDWTAVLAPVALGVPGLVVGGRALFRRHVERTAAERLWQRAHRRWRGAVAEHARIVAALERRPDDVELNRWLEIDRLAIHNRALANHGLRPSDVLVDLVLTEGSPGCVRARDRYGPARYSWYRVHVYLLTDKVLRESVFLLHTRTGFHEEIERRVHRYEDVASATLEAFADDLTPEKDERADEDGRARRTRAQAFRLALRSGDASVVHVTNYGRLAEDDEDPRALHQLSLDVAGITTALPVLEEVAAHGADWVDLFKERTRSPVAAPAQGRAPAAGAPDGSQGPGGPSGGRPPWQVAPDDVAPVAGRADDDEDEDETWLWYGHYSLLDHVDWAAWLADRRHVRPWPHWV